MNFLSNLKIFVIVRNSINMAYMVLYMRSTSLYLTCLSIQLRKNSVLKATQSNSYILCKRN